jgi:CIC family chloride channel protein
MKRRTRRPPGLEGQSAGRSARRPAWLRLDRLIPHPGVSRSPSPMDAIAPLAAPSIPADRNRGPHTEDAEDHSGLLGLTLAGLAVGVLTGVASSAFHLVLDRADALRGVAIAWSHVRPGVGWLVPVGLAALAAFTARWLVLRFAPEASGSGVQHVEAVVRGEMTPARVAVLPVKFFGGTLAIGAGLALGREGPTVQMSATIGHLFARGFRLRAADARALLAAGAGAGLAVAFNAPLGGAIFVFEELVRRFELRVGVAALAACGAALAVMRMLIGDRLAFVLPPLEVEVFPGYLAFLVFGGVLGLLGVGYNRMVVAGLDAAERMHRASPEMRAAVVGAGVGLLAWFAPDLVGGGETLVQGVLDGSHPAAILVLIFAVRLVLGPVCYAPGLPGGLFAPLLAIGASAGALYGLGCARVLPTLTTPVSAFAAVGMGALFVAVVRAPVTGIALVVEMTGSTALFIPLLTACASALAVPSALGEAPIYDTLRERVGLCRTAAASIARG